MKRIILLISLGCFVMNLFGQGFLKPIDTLNTRGCNSEITLNEFSNGDIFIGNISIADSWSTGTRPVSFTTHKFSNEGQLIPRNTPVEALNNFVHILPNDSYVILGDYGFQENSGTQIVASMYSADDEQLWINSYTEFDQFRKNIVKGAIAVHNGFIIYGSRKSSDNVASNPFVFKISFSGEVDWEISIDVSGNFIDSYEFDLSNRFWHERNPTIKVSDNVGLDTIKLVANNTEYCINTDGDIISESPVIRYEKISILDIPIGQADNIIDVEDRKISKFLVADGEITVSDVIVTSEYYDEETMQFKEEIQTLIYVSKHDLQTRQFIWSTFISNDGGGETPVGHLNILPNGNLLFVGGNTGNFINNTAIKPVFVEIDQQNGDIIRFNNIGAPLPEELLIYRVFEVDSFYMCVAFKNRQTLYQELVFFKLDHDLNSFDFVRTNIREDRTQPCNGFYSVIPLSNGHYAGVYGVGNDFSSLFYAFRADENGFIYSNELNGNVIGDLSNDCIVDSLDVDLSNWEIVASGSQEFRTSSRQDGSYTMQIDTGKYQLSIIPRNDYWLNCDTTEIEFLNFSDTLHNVVLTTSAISPCSFIEVDVGFGFLRRCFSNRVVVQYCNQGTFAEEEAMVELNMDSFLDVDNTSIPIADQLDTTLFFDIGEVGIGECGKFNIWVTPNCDNTVLGQEHCINAHVFPDTLCVPQDSLWSGANVVVEAICEGDSTLFKLINIGNAPTKEDLTYIVIVDDIIVSRDDTYSLAAGESIQFVEYEPGSSIKVIAEQEPFHPLGNQVGVEAFCAGTDFDFISEFNQYDDDPFTDMVCLENIGSYDPNDKSAIPEGTGLEHFISSSQNLEYKIRFQNTGTDTAFKVVIRDTIASELDMSTFKSGIGSHDYSLIIEQGNILVFTFDDILLPDSTTNWVESNGFVEFKINQVDENLPDTRIENTAAIFFDFNDPIITNTVFHTIETPVTFSMTSVDLCANEMYDQVFYPNDTTISVLHASPLLDSFAIVNIHSLPVDTTIQHLNVEYGTTINEALITVDTTIYERYTNSVGCDSVLVQNITVENTTSISLVDKGYWEVFPNPTKGSLTIATSQSFTDDRYTVNVMNIVGVSVYEQDHKISPNENLSLDLRNLSAGTYLLSISSEHGMITEKIVINP